MTITEKMLTDDDLLNNICQTLKLLEKRSFDLLNNKQFNFKDIFLTTIPKTAQNNRNHSETLIKINGIILKDNTVFDTKTYKFICNFTSNHVLLVSSIGNVSDKRLEKKSNTTLIQLLNHIKSVIIIDVYKTYYPHFETKQLTSRSANMILNHMGFNKQ